jgi:hypothetical protein
MASLCHYAVLVSSYNWNRSIFSYAISSGAALVTVEVVFSNPILPISYMIVILVRLRLKDEITEPIE